MQVQEVRKLIAQENFRAALLGAKSFHLGVTKEQRSAIIRAYECMVFPDFYRSIGKNIHECINSGISVLKEVVG